jgi:hypothetical protein
VTAGIAAVTSDIRAVTAAQIGLVREIVTGLSDSDLVLGTGCVGWHVADLLVHLRFDAAEVPACFADPTGLPADRDFVTYWRDWRATTEPVTFAQVRWHWANAGAYASADLLRQHFADTAAAAAAASMNAPTGRFRFQEHVMDADDLLAMWTVEFALHHLDLITELPGRPGPLAEAIGVATRTLNGLLGHEPPPWWDDLAYVRKGTGREPLDAADTELLGPLAAGYPAFG